MAYATPGTVAAGDVATAAAWNVVVGDIVDHESRLTQIKRLAYQTRTTSYTVDQTAIASAANVFGTSAIWTADGTSAYSVEVYFPRVTAPANTATYVEIDLYNVTTAASIGTLGFVQTNSATPEMSTAFFGKYFYTPAAGTTTLNVRVVRSAASVNGNVAMGSGGAALTSYMPGFIAVYGPPLT
jgi:hypothetical protein